jgi:hypothetical protein
MAGYSINKGPPPNQRAAGNGGITLPFQIEHPWPAVPEHNRSGNNNSNDGRHDKQL